MNNTGLKGKRGELVVPETITMVPIPQVAIFPDRAVTGNEDHQCHVKKPSN